MTKGKKLLKILLIVFSVIVLFFLVGIPVDRYRVNAHIARRVQTLSDFPLFEDDGITISFSYDLNRRDLYMDLIERFNLDVITAGYSDVALMLVLMDWVVDTIGHYGNSWWPPPGGTDAMSIIAYAENYNNRINCRGLAIVLAEVLRLYGIPAKHITAYPYEDDHPVHVVTHAYSQRLNQWILLDPTLRVFVTDEYGNFLNLYTLRKAFVDGTPILINENASHNGRRYTLRRYRLFMSDYLFRFSTGTNFTFGSEETGANTTNVMLVPSGFSGGGWEITTTSANAFFATP
ncbi:MAG: transglutaminase-like domain-containing protein [Defluviitaleaceae bacterium]|nr:transglutaminase-like domain-containing protein [Defluviitaleaceae bacterium]MCL2238634.1 transglutaminase-like domain-containing protein [Defluviitaleaceae bacterium]